MGVALLGGLSNVSISPWLKALGRLCPLRGKSITAKGLVLTCCSLRRKLKNDFKTEIRRALVRWETLLRVLQFSRNSWITVTSIVFRLLLFLEVRYSKKRVTSAEYASILFSASRRSEMRWWRYNSSRVASRRGRAMALTPCGVKPPDYIWEERKKPDIISGFFQKAAEIDCYIDFLILLNLRSFLRASACFRRFFTLGFS